MDLLKPLLGITRRVAKDTDFTNAFTVGNQINVPLPGTFSAPRKGAAANANVQTVRGMSTVSVTLAFHRTVDFLVYDVTAAQSNPGLMQSLMKSSVAALGRAIEQDVAAVLMTGSNSSGTAGTDLSGSALRTAERNLDNRFAPADERYMAVSPKDKAALLGDAELRGYFQFQSPEALRQGTLGQLYGFETFMTQLAPQTAVQRLNFVGGNNGETFRLRWNNFETADIAFNTTAATLVSNIQTALQALVDPITIGSNVTVAGTVITAIDITFAGIGLRYPSAIVYSTEGVSGTANSGTCAVSTTGTITTTNLAFHKNAAVFAARRFAQVPQGQGVVVAEAQDDDPDQGTGITLRVMAWYDGTARAYRVGLDVLYGVAQGRDAMTERLLA
jgi:hypothetical protein